MAVAPRIPRPDPTSRGVMPREALEQLMLAHALHLRPQRLCLLAYLLPDTRAAGWPTYAEGGSVATRQLLGDYATPARFATPMRTPARTPAAGGNCVMQEAQNLRRLQAGQTPLLGGENPELHPSDFSGVTPRAAPTQTPNPLAAAAAAVGATPGRAVAGVAATPSLGGAAGATPGRAVAGVAATPLLGATPGRGGAGGPPSATPTPMRDALGLNDPDSFSGAAASKREEAARLALQRNELRAGLSQLPAPRNEYQIVVPELPGGGDAHRALLPWAGPGQRGGPCRAACLLAALGRSLLSRSARPAGGRAVQRRRPLPRSLRRTQPTARRGARPPPRPPARRSCASGQTCCSAACRARPRSTCCRSRAQTRRWGAASRLAALHRPCCAASWSAESVGCLQTGARLAGCASIATAPVRQPAHSADLPTATSKPAEVAVSGAPAALLRCPMRWPAHTAASAPRAPQLERLSVRELAEELLHREYTALIAYEAAKYPLHERKDKKGKAGGGAAANGAVAPIEEVSVDPRGSVSRASNGMQRTQPQRVPASLPCSVRAVLSCNAPTLCMFLPALRHGSPGTLGASPACALPALRPPNAPRSASAHAAGTSYPQPPTHPTPPRHPAV